MPTTRTILYNPENRVTTRKARKTVGTKDKHMPRRLNKTPATVQLIREVAARGGPLSVVDENRLGFQIRITHDGHTQQVRLNIKGEPAKWSDRSLIRGALAETNERVRMGRYTSIRTMLNSWLRQ